MMKMGARLVFPLKELGSQDAEDFFFVCGIMTINYYILWLLATTCG